MCPGWLVEGHMSWLACEGEEAKQRERWAAWWQLLLLLLVLVLVLVLVLALLGLQA